jgi:Endonuclease/Exonuclease/phosphatase family
MLLKNFRVGTFNVYNLIQPNQTYYGNKKYSEADYAKKTTWIGGQLERMRADIVGFQEVFHPDALKPALEKSGILTKAEIAFAPNQEGTPGLAIASRFPILEQQVYQAFPDNALLDIEGATIPLSKFSRPILSARMKVTESIECTVFVAHLKSKRPLLAEGSDRNDPLEVAKGQARSLIIRAAETTALRTLFMQTLRDRNHPVIVLGDMNDNSLAVTTQIITGEQPFRRLPLEQRKAIWEVYLYSVKDIQARQSYGDFYYTHIHNGHHESLDHILVSQEFAAQNPDRLGRIGYVSVLNDHLVDETITEGVENWQSDHGQVVVEIEIERRKTN